MSTATPTPPPALQSDALPALATRPAQAQAAVGLRTLAHAGFVVATLTGLHFIVGTFGMAWNWRITLALAVGAIARPLYPGDPYRVMMATGLAVLALWKPTFALYELPFLLGLWLLRHRPRAFFAVLITFGLVVPKTMRTLFREQPVYWGWLSQTALTHILLVAALFFVEKRRNRVQDATLPQWITLFASATNALNPLNFGPLDLWRKLELKYAATAQTLLLIASKATAIWWIDGRWPGLLFANLGGTSLGELGFAELWLVVGVNYLRLALYLSGTADIAVLILRVFGWHLEHPYRWALLAWNPVELWRRWSIYNRKLLLKLIYFPLGGGQKRRYLNVMATFLASALLLHSGWFGSVYWVVGTAGWRDQSVYFLLQGVAVCACLLLWQLRGKDPGSDRKLRVSAPRVVGTVATQAYSALVHIIVLAPKLDWAERWRVMGRCLGFD